MVCTTRSRALAPRKSERRKKPRKRDPRNKEGLSMRMRRAVVGVGAGLLLAAVPVMAHHAFSAEFDINKPFNLRGTLTKWEMVNPHSWFHLDVKGENGTVVPWMIEGGAILPAPARGSRSARTPAPAAANNRGHRVHAHPVVRVRVDDLIPNPVP